MQSILSLSLVSVPIWPGVLVPDRVLSVGQIVQSDIYLCVNK